jgi:hypothetical protein
MDMGTTRVILVEGYKMIRDILKPLIEQVDSCEVVVEAARGKGDRYHTQGSGRFNHLRYEPA